MSSKSINVDQKLAVNRFLVDESYRHIKIRDQEACKNCETRPCTVACPAKLYEWNEETKEMMYNYEGCLECGTCLLICPHDNLDWNYPRGGFGVQYRLG